MTHLTSLPNVFLLSADSLRYDYFSEAQEQIADLTGGVSYTNAVAPATQTSSSMPALATGRYTDEFETWGLPASGDPKPLSEVFGEFGYTSGLWSDNFLFGSEYNYDRGFDGGDLGKQTWKKRLSMALQNSSAKRMFPAVEWAYFNIFKRLTGSLGREENFYRSARQLHDSALVWLTRQDRPTFAWVHYMDTHHPFEPPSEYLDRYEFNTPRSRGELSQLTREAIKANGEGYSSAEIEDVERAYAAACEYQGEEVVSFVRELKERGQYVPERDILVFTADHGECLSFDKYGMLGHVPPAVWEEVVRVPLVVSTPEWDREMIHEQVPLVGLYDMLISAVETTGVDSGIDFGEPKALTSEIARFVTEWEVPWEDGEIRTYRGVRRDDGTKLFGGRVEDEDQIVLTEYDTDSLNDEIRYKARNANALGDQRLSKIWTELANEVNSSLIERTTTIKQLNEEHLRDLGYID